MGEQPPETLLVGADRDLIEGYLRFRANRLDEKSASAYRTDLVDFAVALKGAGLVNATSADVSEWFRLRIRDPNKPLDARPWSVRTAHRKKSALVGFYDWLVDNDRLQKNPAARVELHRVQRERPDRMPASESDKLFEYIEHKISVSDDRTAQLYILDAVIFRLCYNLSLRVSEASHPRLSDVRRRKDGLYILIRKKGRKNKPYPITGIVEAVYRRWLNIRQGVLIRPGHEDFLFVHPWFGGRVSRKRAWERIQLLAAEAGLSEETLRHLTPHTLRHANAYHLLSKGEPLNAVQSVLDHANIATTSIYVEDDEHARIEALRRSSRKRRPQ
jgi:integrase/recombinase XerD